MLEWQFNLQKQTDLLRSKQLFRQLWNNDSDGMLLIDPRGPCWRQTTPFAVKFK